jgi:hypothetical protein
MTRASLRRFVNIYLNDEDVRYLRRQGHAARTMATPVSFLPALAGGL